MTGSAARATTGKVRPVGRPDQLSNLDNKTDADRAQESGISRAKQKKLDKLAHEAPNLLKQVQAGERSCRSAATLPSWPLLAWQSVCWNV